MYLFMSGSSKGGVVRGAPWPVVEIEIMACTCLAYFYQIRFLIVIPQNQFTSELLTPEEKRKKNKRKKNNKKQQNEKNRSRRRKKTRRNNKKKKKEQEKEHKIQSCQRR